MVSAGVSAGFGGSWLLFGGLATIAFGTVGALASQGMARLAGFSVLVPERRNEIVGMVWKAMMAGFLATCLTASIVGLLPAGLFGG